MLVTDVIAQLDGDRILESGNEMSERKSFSVAHSRTHRTRTLAELIGSARPPESLLQSSKGQLWLAEATSRSCNLLQLFLALEVKSWEHAGPSIRSQLDCALAGSLCASFRNLDHCTGQRAVECADLFRGVVDGIVTLFERAVGTLTLVMQIEQLSLTSEKRRALVLCATELLLTAIRCGFHSQSAGIISIGLKLTSLSHTTLTVSITGSRLKHDEENKSIAIVIGLAGILDGDVILRRSPAGSTFVEVTFPHL